MGVLIGQSVIYVKLGYGLQVTILAPVAGGDVAAARRRTPAGGGRAVVLGGTKKV